MDDLNSVSQEFVMDFDQAVEIPPEIEPGTYLGIVRDAKMVRSKANPNNQYCQITLEISDGKYKGKTVIDRLNVINGNDRTAKTAQATLRCIGLALGLRRMKNVTELVNTGKALSFDVILQKNSNPQYPDSPSIKAYYPVGANSQHVANEALREAPTPSAWGGAGAAATTAEATPDDAF